MKTVEQIIEEAKKKVTVSCCEYHAHSAKRDCLSGPKHAIEVCVLAEEIAKLRNKLNDITTIASE